ncbi:MAG: glycosyltransferase family 2 protein [Patescibacteria group bacterium]|nr:glycosyltransferase family 2 protein [Patescibacteria group bacterium]
MKISFVIPAYNEEERVGACIDSIQKELQNTGLRNPYFSAEIIVVNNASTDRTKEVALGRSSDGQLMRVIDEPKKGLVMARQAGFDASTGELVANIDADVLLPAGWLSTVMRAFERDQQLVCLSGPFIYYDISRFSRAMVKVFYFFAFILYFITRFILHIGSMVQGGNFVIKRSAMLQVGGYDTSISFYGEDTDVARRMNKVGKVRWTFALPVYTSGRRFKGEGIITTSARYTVNYFWVTFFGRPFTNVYKDIRPSR